MVCEGQDIDGSFHGLCAILALSQSRTQSVTLALIRRLGSAMEIFVLEFAITGTLILTFSVPVMISASSGSTCVDEMQPGT